jgi:RHS repeat-associated protein
MTGPDGAVAWLADLTAFGLASVAFEQVRNPLRFAGQYFDPETGLHYNRFRYYSPEWGRYITRDPLGFAADTNFYSYAGNDPINQTDPLGLWWQTALAIAGSVVAGVAVAAAIVALAPAVTGLAAVGLLLAGGALVGAVAGAVGEGLNELLNGQHVCWPCILKAAGYGAIAGAVASTAFIGLGAAAGIGAFMARGALGGALGYATNYFDGGNPHWSTAAFLGSIALGAVTAGAFKYVGGSRSARTTASEGKPASAPVGTRSQPADFDGNSPATINGKEYSGHAIDRMQGRGLTPSVIEDAMQPGNRVGPGNTPGTSKYYSPENGVTVIADDTSGRVITTY